MTLASLPGKKSSERGEGGLWMDPSSFSIEFQRGKENGVGGFVVDCEWTGGAGAERRRRRSRPACTSEGASNTLSTGGFPDQLLVGGEKCLCDEKPNGIVRIAVWPLWPGSIGIRKTRDDIPGVAGAPGRLFTCCGACLVYCRPIRLSWSRFTPTRPALIASLPGCSPQPPLFIPSRPAISS
jgi:hypothetical protein